MTTPIQVVMTAQKSLQPMSIVDVDALGQHQAVNCLRDRLRAHGLAVFTGIPSSNDLHGLAAGIMTIVPHPDSDDSGMTTITDLGPAGDQPNAAGFSRRALYPHTDRSGVSTPPALLMTSCAHAAGSGGSTLLADGQAIHDDLAVTTPDALAAFTRRRAVLFGGSNGFRGSVFTNIAASHEPPRRTIRFRLDDLAQFSPDVEMWVPHLKAAIDRHTFAVHLNAGEGYVLDNHRWLHGRDAYEGSRSVYRFLGNPLPEPRYRHRVRP